MSGIYGLLNIDGAPVSPDTISVMRRSMKYYGPDGGGESIEGSVGLGSLLHRVTSEDTYESQPVQEEGCSLVASARLDNREELLRVLGINPNERAVPDTVLVLKSYLRWGESCTDHLDGDWQFAVWDSKRRSLLLARDHHGNTAVYYCRTDRTFIFASSLKAVIAHPDVHPRPDMLRMAQVLTSWQGEGWRTAYEKVFRLPPAHVIRVQGSEFKLWRYWFPENLPLIRRAKNEEYVEEFLDIYQQAVRARLRSALPIGVTLSGGLDSGSVAALAAPLLAGEGRTFAAFTSVPLYEPSGAGTRRTGNEWEMASATACMAGSNVRHVAVRAENTSVLAGIRRQLEVQDGPGHAAGNQYWIADLLEKARETEIGVLLTGQCGNSTISFAGNGQFIYPLLKGNFKEALQVLLFAESNIFDTCKRQILKPLLSPCLYLYRRCSSPWTDPWSSYSPITKELAREVHLAERMRDSGHDPTFTFLANRHRLQLGILRLGDNSIGARWHESGAWYGLDIRDPTTDRRLIEFCLQTPDEQFRRGKQRLLLRRAMAGRMPDTVLNNSRKGLQAADLGWRVLAEQPSLAATLNEFANTPLVRECIDIPRMKAILEGLADGVDESATKRCVTTLVRGIGVGVFISQFK